MKYRFRISVAIVHTWVGEAESALRECERLLQTMASRNPTVWWINVHAMRRHPALAPLRDNPKNNARWL